MPQNWVVAQPCFTSHQITITQWEEGKSDLWLQQEADYNAYQSIINYNPELIDTETEEPYPAPQGWNSEEDVVASQTANSNWNQCITDNPTEPEICGLEPVVLLRPSELPVVPPPNPLEEDLVPNTIEPYDKYYGLDLGQVKEINQNSVDAECKAHIYAAWSIESQYNMNAGLYTQEISEIGKSEISSALAENKVFIDHIETLATAQEIDDYVATITRETLTGGRA